MNSVILRYLRLTAIMIKNEKKLIMLSLFSIIVGCTFIFIVGSLSDTIIKTKQDEVLKRYGNFLAVVPGIDSEREQEIKEDCGDFEYKHFGVLGNVKYKDKEITMGLMKEDMGKNLAFRLINGRWAAKSDEIVIEEYLLSLFGAEEKKLPFNVSLIKDSEKKSYKVTGVISNYSSFISTDYGEYVKTKIYPSIICGQNSDAEVKKSLVITQKKVDFKRAKSDIENVLFGNISEDIMCVNEKMYSYGYNDNEDMISTKTFYPVLIVILLLIEHIVLINAFVIRNKISFSLFRTFGMTQKDCKKAVFYMMLVITAIGMFAGCILAVIIGVTYIKNVFNGYAGYYLSSLVGAVLWQTVICAVIFVCAYSICVSKNRLAVLKKTYRRQNEKTKKYRFKKIDISIIFVQTVCIFFVLASFYFINVFSDKEENINYDLVSKIDQVSYPLRGYDIGLNGDDYFSFDDLKIFDRYRDKINISMEAETKQCSILLDKGNVDKYFSDYIKENSYYSSNENDVSTKEKNDTLWKQVADKAEKYESVTENIITVLPEREFQAFLKKNSIRKSAFSNSGEKACVVILPDYKEKGKMSSPSIKENGEIKLGGIRGDEKKVNFYSENFKVGALLSENSEESSSIEIVMDEKTAIKSRTVLGCNNITIEMDKNTVMPVQKEVEREVMCLMASIQGGRVDSSGVKASERKLLLDYTAVLSKTIMVFSMIIIGIYITLDIYIDWEKHRYEYGVMRSFGMSYSRLQRKLFLRYSNSIIVAGLLSLFFVKGAYMSDMLSKWQIIISVLFVVIFTYACRVVSYYEKRHETVSMMLGEGE